MTDNKDAIDKLVNTALRMCDEMDEHGWSMPQLRMAANTARLTLLARREDATTQMREALTGKPLLLMGREHVDDPKKPLAEISFGMVLDDKVLFCMKDTHAKLPGLPVAEVVQREAYVDGSPNPHHDLKWNLSSCEDDLPVGAKLYTGPTPIAPRSDDERAADKAAMAQVHFDGFHDDGSIPRSKFPTNPTSDN